MFRLAAFFVIGGAILVKPSAATAEDFQGWCTIWRSGSYVEDKKCIATRLKSSGEEAGLFRYTWPSGAKTVVEWIDGTPESINGYNGELVVIRGNDCIRNPKTQNTFCFSNGRIANAADGAYQSSWVRDQLVDEENKLNNTKIENSSDHLMIQYMSVPIPQNVTNLQNHCIVGNHVDLQSRSTAGENLRRKFDLHRLKMGCK